MAKRKPNNGAALTRLYRHRRRWNIVVNPESDNSTRVTVTFRQNTPWPIEFNVWRNGLANALNRASETIEDTEAVFLEIARHKQAMEAFGHEHRIPDSYRRANV